MLRVHVCVLLAMTATFGGCGSDDAGRSIDADDAGTITVRFTDSSTPPQFHRSWSLTVTNGNYDASVSSYGDPKATGTGTIDDAAVAAFLAALGDLATPPDDDGVACTGGSSYFIQVLDTAGATLRQVASPQGCNDDARSWNSEAGSVAKILSAAVDYGPLYDEVDAAFDE